MSEGAFNTRFQYDDHIHAVAKIYINRQFLHFQTMCKVITEVPRNRSIKS